MKRRVLMSMLAVALVFAVSTQMTQASGFGFRLFAKNACSPCEAACEPCAPAACVPCAPACEPACDDCCGAPACRPFAGFRAKFRCHLDSLRARCATPCAAPCATACEPVVCAPCEPVVAACEPTCGDCCDPCDSCCRPTFRPFAKLRDRLASLQFCGCGCGCGSPCATPCDAVSPACMPCQ